MVASRERVERGVALPAQMQGNWICVEDPSQELVVRGAEIIFNGDAVDYDYMEIGHIDGAVTADLKVEDEARVDEFERASITGLVIDPDGDFFAFNVKWAEQFVRPQDR